MNLLFVTSNFGSNKDIGFMPIMASRLSDRGHNVRGLQYEENHSIDHFQIDQIPTKEVYTPYWAGQWLFYRDWIPKVKEYIKSQNPNAVVTDRRCMAPTILASQAVDTPVIGVIPGLGFTRFNPYNLDKNKTPRFWNLPTSAKIQYPFINSLFKTHQRAITATDGLVTLSEFLKETVRSTFNRTSTVVRTPVERDSVIAKNHSPKYITMVNPRTELKGANIALDVASKMSDHEFLIAGSFANEVQEKKATKLSNVTALGWVDDMREVYAKTKVLLVPSLVEEGGPRVIGEAFANGIPVVGTTRGGIPEFIGPAGRKVFEPHDISEWRDAIRDVEDSYNYYSNVASERTSIFSLDTQAKLFEDVIIDHA